MGNNLLIEQLSYNGAESTPTLVNVYSYTAKGIDKHSFKSNSDWLVLDANTKYWIKVDGFSDVDLIKDITSHFNLNFLLTQDILNVNHPTKIEEYDDFIICLLKLFIKDLDGEYQPLQVTIVLGENYLITFSEIEHPFMEKIIAALEQNTLRIRQKSVDYLMSVVLNSIVSNHTQVILDVNDNLDDLEELILTNTSAQNLGIEIQKNRKQYIRIKKAILPLREQYGRLLRANAHLIRHENKAYYDDVNDHLQYVLQNIELCREMLSSLADLYISNNDLKMNDVMKRLTVVSTIFIPLTFLVGVWGMNFENMPELSLKYGYIMAWIIMLVIGIAVYIYFKIKKWY